MRTAATQGMARHTASSAATSGQLTSLTLQGQGDGKDRERPL